MGRTVVVVVLRSVQPDRIMSAVWTQKADAKKQNLHLCLTCSARADGQWVRLRSARGTLISLRTCSPFRPPRSTYRLSWKTWYFSCITKRGRRSPLWGSQADSRGEE